MSRRPSGFTLIELMVVVAIIGLLSSVAVPTFKNAQLRSRQTERAIITKSIDLALKEYWVRESRWPNVSGDVSWLSTSWNPDWPPGTQKRRFMKTAMYGDWNRLSLEIEGNVYYCYYAWAYAGGGFRYKYLYTYGDLDGDQRYNYTYDYVYEYLDSAQTRYTYSYDSALDNPAF